LKKFEKIFAGEKYSLRAQEISFFARTNFHEWPLLAFFAGINFRERRFMANRIPADFSNYAVNIVPWFVREMEKKTLEKEFKGIY